ncbi:MAG: hypothetical protein KF902_00170 [Phycisphaeraceae bacterium]|nr:hypothetical protein [Phycisphaeraceae bacterium]
MLPGCLVTYLLLGGLFASILLYPTGALARKWLVYVCLVASAVTTGYAVLVAARIDAARRRAKRAGWQMCPVCLYDLSGDGRSSDADAMRFVCPECGGRYDMDDLRTAWAAPRY